MQNPNELQNALEEPEQGQTVNEGIELDTSEQSPIAIENAQEVQEAVEECAEEEEPLPEEEGVVEEDEESSEDHDESSSEDHGEIIEEVDRSRSPRTRRNDALVFEMYRLPDPPIEHWKIHVLVEFNIYWSNRYAGPVPIRMLIDTEDYEYCPYVSYEEAAAMSGVMENRARVRTMLDADVICARHWQAAHARVFALAGPHFREDWHLDGALDVNMREYRDLNGDTVTDHELISFYRPGSPHIRVFSEVLGNNHRRWRNGIMVL